MTTQERNIKVLALDILALRQRRNEYLGRGSNRAVECQNEINDRFTSADNRGLGDLVRAEILQYREAYGVDTYSEDRSFFKATQKQVDWVGILATI
jgi:hypothetical protein